MYKKIFFIIWIVITIVINVNARNGFDPFTFDTQDCEFVYNYNINQCTPFLASDKVLVVEKVRTGKIFIDDYGENEAGTYTELSYEVENGVKILSVFSTYGECKYFEEYIIQDRGILTDIKKYIGLKYIAK